MDLECMCCLAIVEDPLSELCENCSIAGCGPEEEMC